MFGALTTSTLVASKPGSTCCRLTNVRTSNPAPTSTTNEMAICTATSARCARRSMRPLVERWPPLTAELEETAPGAGSRGVQAKSIAAATPTSSENARPCVLSCSASARSVSRPV